MDKTVQEAEPVPNGQIRRECKHRQFCSALLAGCMDVCRIQRDTADFGRPSQQPLGPGLSFVPSVSSSDRKLSSQQLSSEMVAVHVRAGVSRDGCRPF